MSCDDRTGALLRTLAAAKPGGRILELGTGAGVGAAWLLAGMDSRSQLVTVEADESAAEVARASLAVDHRVELVVGDAVAWLTGYSGPPFDLAFVDCLPGKFSHRGQVLARLAPGALYVGDDLLAHPAWPDEHHERVAGFLAEIVAEPELVVTLMSWSTGLVVASYRPEGG